MPEKEFATYLQQSESQGKAPSSHGLCCLAKMHAEKMKRAGNHEDHIPRLARTLQNMADHGKRFASIYVDPPSAPASKWRVNSSSIDTRLTHLPVMEVAAFQAHLYLKVAMESLGDGVKILTKWGFALQTLLILTESSLDPDGSCQATRELLLWGSRDGSGCPILRLPHWMKGTGVLTVDSADAVHRYIEQRRAAPYLGLFTSRLFCKGRVIATNLWQ